MGRTFVFERFDLFGDRTPAADGEFVSAQEALDREAILQAEIRTLETQLKDARTAIAGSAVIANAAGAEIAALRELLREVAALRRYDPNNGKRKEPYPARNLTLNVPAELLDRIDALCAGTPRPREGHFLPAELTPPVRRILGMMLWETGPIAGALRAAGKQINNRAEDEQAAVLHWLLGFALEHGMDWQKPAAAALHKMTQGIKD